MRVSTSMFYERATKQMVAQSSEMAKTQKQLATGRKIVDASDDPVGASKIVQLEQSISVNAQFIKNQGQAEDQLSLTESRLSGITDVMQYVRDRVIESGNGSYSDTQLNALAVDMRAQFDNLVSLGNSQDASGDYLFSGYKTGTQPFQGNLAGITYEGDQGSRNIRISQSREIPVSLNGSDFMGNIFGAVADFITKLESGVPMSGSDVSSTLSEVDVALEKTLSAQATIGSYRIEIENMGNISQNLDTQYQTSVSSYRDTDYAEAATRLSQQQFFLESAQAAFVKTAGLSLFNYIR